MFARFLVGVMLFAALPATSTYKLNSYGFGSGGTSGASTATYSLEGSSGEISSTGNSTTTYTVKPGTTQGAQANVPLIATLDNNSGEYYNKLHFVLDTQNNPSDTKYLIEVKTSAFTSPIAYPDGAQYLKPDGTLSATVNATYYQTYASWGGASGSLIIGLVPSTTYYVRAKAVQGRYTESQPGAARSQATAAPSLTFSLVTSTQPSPPYSVNFGSLTAGTIATSSNTINTTLSTNGTSGGNIYIVSKNGGLLSSSTGGRIDSITTDLSSSAHGFGAQNSSVGQTSGGPFTVVSPFGISGNNVANITTTAQSLYTSSNPVTNGAGVLLLKAKPSATDVAAADYQEILTFIASGNF